MVTKAKKALLASLAAFLCVMLTVFGLSMSVSLSETAKAADETSAVAQVGTTTYGTLNGAIGDAAEGNTVTLLKDTTEDVEVNKNITLDLDGKTLTGTKTSGKASLTVVKGATATVKNGTILGTENGYYTIQNNGTATFESLTATAGNTGSSMIDNWGTLTITSGTYTGGLNVVKSEEDSTLTINGGQFTLNYSTGDYTGVIFAYGDTTITGGEFIQSTNLNWHYPQVVLTGVVEGHTAITRVTGGSFINKSSSSTCKIFHGYTPATSDNFEVSGGTFNKSISEGYCAEGFIPSTTKNADGMYGVKEGKYVAKVGSTKYETLKDAFNALKSGSYNLTLLDENVWDASTPVYWRVNKDKSGYTKTLAEALTAVYKANGRVTCKIVCRPGADVGTLTHGHVADSINIYGNNAYISGGECDLEVDTYKFSRTTGAQANDGVALDKDITINAYELDNLGVWGQRTTNHKVTVNLTDCDGKEIAGKNNVQRVYISGTAGVNNLTIKKCDFLTKATSIYSNADGRIVVDNCTFTGSQVPLNINHKADGAVTLEVTNSTFTSCGDAGEWKKFAAPARFVNSGSGTMTVTAKTLKFNGTVGSNGDILLGDGREGQKSNGVTLKVTSTAANIQAQKPGYYNADGTTNETKGGTLAAVATESYTTTVEDLAPEKGSEKNPYTLEELGAMTRAEYIAAQEKLGGTMYVTVGNYSYETNGVLGNGVRNDTPGQVPDHSKLNAYGENGYLGANNDGANGKNIVFVGGSITSGVTGYASIDNIGTSLLLAVPAYTNVTFKGTTFNNVMSFDYQLYTSPWSQLGGLEFDGCTFNGLIVGAIASQTLTFNKCTFTDYTNTVSANSSNPTWIRPAYGNWTKGDNEGQGGDFKSLTTINFTGNNVTSTRPVKFERIAQWEMTTTVTATNNEFTISAQDGDTNTTKNVGLYLGANAKFDLKVENNTKLGSTAALYTAVYSAPSGVSYAGLPAGSTVTDTKGNAVTVEDAYEWKTSTKLTLETTTEVASVTNAKGVTVNFATLQAAFDAAPEKAIVTLLADTRENVTIAKRLTLDLNGYTVNGGTEKGKPAVTVKARVTIKDSSAAQTGTIKREDTAENSGVSSHYVIDIQGAGWLTFEGGKVINNSGNVAGKGASLVRVGDDSVAKFPGLNIKGGTFTQNNFIVIKIDSGDLFLNGGTLTSANSYAIENWHRATVKGGTVNGAVSSWTYSGGFNSTLTISGGTINGNVTSVNYGNTTDKKAKVSVTGGTVNGELDTRSYDPATGKLTSISDAAKATIEVTGGTFSKDPTKYVVEESAITKNADGTYGVEKAYLAKVGDTSYYTMDEAFKAQTASGEAIVLLRDYTTASTFNSGTKHRVVDLNGHTWTYTGTDTNSAAFEINYPNVTLTVKNGKIISSTIVGLIPSAMGGTITYDNAGLVFEKVEMTSNGSSGIETNGNNTNDSVTLINSTLNVPNGFGIYFPSSGTLTIDNSKITAKTMGVQVCSGELVISGDSEITVTGDAVPKTENDGAIQDGAAISIVNRPGYKGLSNIVITGGKFTAKAGNDAIKAYDWNNAENKGSDFTKADLVAVSGGTFSSEVKKDYLANGFRLTKTGESYGVTAKYIKSTHVSLGTALSFSYKLRDLEAGETIKNAKASYRTVRGNLVEIDMTLVDGYYVFDGITPQMLDRKISVNVYVGDTVVYDVVDYSILDYLQDVLNSNLGTKATVTKQLVADLAFYGKAAMKYVGYTTTVVDKFIADNGLTQSTGEMTGLATSEGTVKVANVSVQFASQNKILIGVAESVFDDYSYTIKVNGTVIDEALWQKGVVDGYRVYVSDGFAASYITDENHYVEVEVLKNETSVQKVRCNVAGYCMKMAKNARMGELAKATYYYGVSAAEYANFKG